MKLIVDASVAVKWFFPDPKTEPDANHAVELLQAIGAGDVDLIQPPHWLAEVIAVVTRIKPELATTAIDLLDTLEIPVCNDAQAYQLAAKLADEMQHHLFDTLYHAVAIQHHATLITADLKYLGKASRYGHIQGLAQWRHDV